MARNKALCCWSDHNHCRYLDFPDQSNRANAAIHFREGARSAVTPLGWRWIVDAHREGRRYMVHSDELLSAFWSWRRRCGSAESQEDPIVSDHRYNFIHSNAEYGRNR